MGFMVCPVGNPGAEGTLMLGLQEPGEPSGGLMDGLAKQVAFVEESLGAEVEEGRFRQRSTCPFIPAKNMSW